jgi:hypothetical protein
MRRITIILAVVIALGAVAVFFAVRTTHSTIKKELRDFAVADTASIDKIFMVEKSNNQVMLTREENGWMVNPMMGSTEPQDLPPEQLKQMKKQADFEGELYEYEKKGSTLELIGDEDFEGTKVYKLKLTDKDGDITYYFIDAETYVVIKTNAKRNINGTEVEGETLFSNFQMIDGMAFPYSISTGMNGQTMAEIVIEKVDFSKKLDPTFFNKPINSCTTLP